ncbi:CES2 [Mytilus coruscus]|uniref:CES2 n=1 Tax=Mytilus coruscus TaxID=42192 RepID=A0A6J8DJU9_MYTCO|nr:CES2 [Mytilus coruscus]
MLFTTGEIYKHNSRLGQIIGITTFKYNTTLYHFKKIQYAKPPLASLRFKKPEQFGSWEGALNGTEYGPNCMQFVYENDKRLIPNLETSEDCLHLNMFAPTDLNRNSRRPVMIWIHGGAFTNGQGMMFDGSKLAAVGDVILVTINYRLNIFGFVNVGKESTRNIGLLDQRFAIEWVKDNIKDYGGNPEMITIFGKSTGGTSVQLQSMIPKNRGLFQRAIAQSAYMDGIRDSDNYEKLTRNTGGILNCSVCKTETISCLDCLKNVSAVHLLNAYAKSAHNLDNEFSLASKIGAIGPTVDNELIPGIPINILTYPDSEASQMFNSIDYIAGSNDFEGGLFYLSLLGEKNFNLDLEKGIPSHIICNLFAPYVTRVFYKDCEVVSQEICKKYSPTDTTNSLSMETIFSANAYADFEFASLASKDLNFHSRSQRGTYQYLLTHEPNWGLIQTRPSWLVGANHADELVFLFGWENWYPTDIAVTQYEDDLSSKMMQFWLNFAKTGYGFIRVKLFF